MIFHQPGNSFSNYTYNATIYHNVEWSHHFHKNFELIYVISGTVNCIVNHQADTLKAGDWGMCLSNEVHAIRSTEDSLFWVGVFSGDFVHAFEKQIKNKTGEHFKFRCSREIEEYLKAVLINETRPHIYVLKSALYAACSEYCRQIPLKERTNKHDILMKDIVDYISVTGFDIFNRQNVTPKLHLKFLQFIFKVFKFFAIKTAITKCSDVVIGGQLYFIINETQNGT